MSNSELNDIAAQLGLDPSQIVFAKKYSLDKDASNVQEGDFVVCTDNTEGAERFLNNGETYKVLGRKQFLVRVANEDGEEILDASGRPGWHWDRFARVVIETFGDDPDALSSAPVAEFSPPVNEGSTETIITFEEGDTVVCVDDSNQLLGYLGYDELMENDDYVISKVIKMPYGSLVELHGYRGAFSVNRFERVEEDKIDVETAALDSIRDEVFFADPRYLALKEERDRFFEAGKLATSAIGLAIHTLEVRDARISELESYFGQFRHG